MGGSGGGGSGGEGVGDECGGVKFSVNTFYMLFFLKPFLVAGKQLTYMMMMHRLYYCVPFAVSFQLHTPCKAH